ncbi:hypothetical protein N7526_011473 [Penicillium atrosanguineum]|nr:hypothetical protein N7526_011473 [Penicillium atrosanguineum]
MSTSSSWLDEHDDWYPPPRSYGLPSYEEAIAESRIGPERYDNHILASYGQNAPVSLPRVTMSLPDFLMVFSLVLFCLTSLGVLLGGGTEDPTSLALNAAYNSGYHVQHSSITKPSCRVSDDLHQYNVPLPEFLRRFTPNTAPQRVSTRAAIFRNIGDEPEILLAQSKSWRLGSGGMWDTTGAAVDRYSKETILHAAARGLEEETNVKLASLDAWVGEYTFHAPWMLWAKKKSQDHVPRQRRRRRYQPNRHHLEHNKISSILLGYQSSAGEHECASRGVNTVVEERIGGRTKRRPMGENGL